MTHIDPNGKEIKEGGWILAFDYVCRVKHVGSSISAQPVGFETCYLLLDRQVTVISEEEAIMLILKNNKPYFNDF